jgi:hypothetical protein
LFANQQNRQFRDEKEYLIDSTSSAPRRTPWSLSSAVSHPRAPIRLGKLADKQNDDNNDYFEAYMKTVQPDVVEDEYKEYSEGGCMVGPPANLYQW